MCKNVSNKDKADLLENVLDYALKQDERAHETGLCWFLYDYSGELEEVVYKLIAEVMEEWYIKLGGEGRFCYLSSYIYKYYYNKGIIVNLKLAWITAYQDKIKELRGEA